MTPAILLVRKSAIAHQVHEYAHHPDTAAYGLEAAEALDLAPARVFKTLIASLSGGRSPLAMALVPASQQLDLKALARVAGAKRAEMADAPVAERATGYVVGGISPLGQKKRLPLFLDASAQTWPTVYVSAGRRGLEIELAPADLLKLTGGQFAGLTR